MSLRYMSRVVVQGGAKAAQSIRDHSTRSIKDAAASNSATAASSSNRVRRISGAIDSSCTLKPGCAAAVEQRKRAEESLRMVLYLSCWGPN